MSHDQAEDAARLRELCHQISLSGDAKMLKVALAMMTEFAVARRSCVQLSILQIQEITGLAPNTIRRRLEAMEAEGLVNRRRRAGRPSQNHQRGDCFTPADAPGDPADLETPDLEELGAPIRGPTKTTHGLLNPWAVFLWLRQPSKQPA
jgi:hypothetical protein